jgi:dTDP-4-amino-4,6-dideoxygalactose transaminase
MKPKRIFLSPPHMGNSELDFLNSAFESNYIAPLGPMVDAFEREFSEYTGIKHCLALSSGTAAIHLALRHLDVGPGDDVLASTLTFIGSVTPVIFCGARPVFIDCDKTSWNMDPELLEETLAEGARVGRLPKAVIPTDLYGQCANYGRIFAICKKYDIPVVVDAAESMGAVYNWEEMSMEDKKIRRPDDEGLHGLWRHAGWGGKAAAFSFNGNKILTTSGGGMLASNDAVIIEHARFLSQQAKDPYPHYEHSEIGYNYRMSNILAAVGRGQLSVLDERVERKREVFNYYRKALDNVPGIEFMPEASFNKSNRWLTVILVTPEEFGTDHESIRLALEDKNIESRPVWKPMHLQSVFNPQNTQTITDSSGKKRYPCRVVGGEMAEDLFNRGLCLPSGTAMANTDLDCVIDTILKYH